MTDEVSYRVFRLYLAGTAYEFQCGRVNLHQSLLVKSDQGRSGLPLTRHDWYGSDESPAGLFSHSHYGKDEVNGTNQFGHGRSDLPRKGRKPSDQAWSLLGLQAV